MKKILFALLLLIISGCSKENILNEESNFNITKNTENNFKENKIFNHTYVYNNNLYKISVKQLSDKEFTLLEGEDNKYLENIYNTNPDLAIVIFANDSNYYLFDNEEAYENSNFSKEPEPNSNVLNIEQASQEVVFYKRDDFLVSGGGFNRILNGLPYLTENNFHYIYNRYQLGNLFPSSWYNQGVKDINDDVSSLQVRGVQVRLYEHTEFSGKTLILNARGYNNSINISDLDQVTYSCGLFCTTSWNDKISSMLMEP